MKEYFDSKYYKFDTSYFFEPTLNSTLKKYLINNANEVSRKKQIIVYGRPGTQRNAFELVLLSLKEWVKKQENAREWELISVGENHEDINLGKKVILKSLGKLTLEQYVITSYSIHYTKLYDH